MELYVTKHAQQRGTQRLGFGRMEARAKLRRLCESAKPVDGRDLPDWYCNPAHRAPGTTYRRGRWLDREVVLVLVRSDEKDLLLVTVVTPERQERHPFQSPSAGGEDHA